MKSSTRLELANRLYKDPQFKSLKSNSQRVGYLLENVFTYDQLKEMVQTNLDEARDKSRKNFSLARSYKEEADLCYKTDRYDDALAAVHKAILYAPTQETSFRSSLYTLKWMIHKKKKQFKEMLYCAEVCVDIEASISHLKMKISSLGFLGQFATALELIDQVTSKSELFRKDKESLAELLHTKKKLQTQGKMANVGEPEPDKEPYFTYQLEPRCKIINSPVVGRHFEATEYISEGVVLLRERPYSLILELNYWQRKCSSCNLDLKHKFFPCAYCTEPVFCDRVCFQTAWETFHRHECGLASLARSIMTMPAAHVFRIVSRVGPLNAFDIEAAKGDYSIDKYLTETSKGDVPEVAKTREEKDRAYRMASILWDHDEKHSDHSNAHHTVVAVEIAILLDFVHGFRKARPRQDFLVAFASMLLVDMRRIVFNVFGWHEYNDDWSIRGHVANCQCLVGSLINHSCDPNTTWELKDGIIYFTSKRAIAKGEQITITYGPCKSMDYSKRQERLNYYYFACRCDLCWADAKKGDNLRCHQCDGPLPFNSAVNKETQLSGKCINCYQKYDQFEKSVEKLTKVKDSIKVISDVALVRPHEDILQLAIQLLGELIGLSLPESEPICRAVFASSHIIERCSKLTSVKRQAELAMLFDRAFPLAIPEHLINGKCLLSLKFWFDSLVDYMKQATYDKDNAEGKLELKCMWDAANAFKERLRAAMQLLSKDEPTSELVKQMVADVSRQLDLMVERCQMIYIQQASFVSPCLS